MDMCKKFLFIPDIHVWNEGRLEVVWMWLNKDPDPLEHEYIIVQTKDSKDGNLRLFIIDRIVDTRSDTPPSSHSVSTLSLLEEGTLTVYPPVTSSSSQLSSSQCLQQKPLRWF